jgi:hypothetical protein
MTPLAFVAASALTLVAGSIPKGAEINHTCDRRKCGRPSHIYAGTFQQNMEDKVARNRCVRMMGNANPSKRPDVLAKLRRPKTAEHRRNMSLVRLGKCTPAQLAPLRRLGEARRGKPAIRRSQYVSKSL